MIVLFQVHKMNWFYLTFVIQICLDQGNLLVLVFIAIFELHDLGTSHLLYQKLIYIIFVMEHLILSTKNSID